MGCTELTASDCRAFKLVSDEGFFKMTQSIFDAGRYFNNLSNTNINQLIPTPITIIMVWGDPKHIPVWFYY
ncbi:unnamed protein product [Adineta steineri]|uniref:Uncharacterized protein n=1 Tax=Adineta steineri TaxID=433720 RepID=A0A815ISW6_9BILA|nr:unnamed protein product [Adineta steineri]CAF3993749.1 unnamed protein product [Adineta steineri]